jgi:hypothetical protein
MLTSIPQDKIDRYVDELIKANPESKEVQSGDEDSGEELGFGGGVKSEVDPVGDVDKVSKAFGENAARQRRASTGLSTKEVYTRARNRWQEGASRDSLQEEIIRVKAACRFYEGKGQGKHYLSSLRNSNDEMKDRKVMSAFLKESKTNSAVDLREKLSGPREDKQDWEKWD